MYQFTGRARGTKRDGNSWTHAEKLAVWQKAQVAIGFDPSAIRRDACNALIAWSEYGNTNHVLGWEIDHKTPVAHGGTDDLWNLQALQWENNRAKSDGPLVCVRR